MRTKALAAALVGVFMSVVGAQRAEAIPLAVDIDAFTGANAAGVILIDFEDLTTPIIGNHYAALGLSVSDGLLADTTTHLGLPTSLGFGAIAASNSDPFVPTVTFNFLQVGRRFGFDIITLDNALTDFTVTSFLNGVQTGTLVVPFHTGGEPNFIGVADDNPNAYFDKIVVSSFAGDHQTTPKGFIVDNVRMVVPEPESLSLLALGTLMLLFGASTGLLKKA